MAVNRKISACIALASVVSAEQTAPGMTTSSGAGFKRAIVRFFQKKVVNPRVVRTAGDLGNRYALLETIGRTSGVARQNPVGNGLIGGEFWIVAEHGEQAQYVKNIRANSLVRVRVDGAWRPGLAVILPDDDPLQRQRTLDPKTAREVRMLGTDLLTIRIDLDPLEPSGSS